MRHESTPGESSLCFVGVMLHHEHRARAEGSRGGARRRACRVIVYVDCPAKARLACQEHLRVSVMAAPSRAVGTFANKRVEPHRTKPTRCRADWKDSAGRAPCMPGSTQPRSSFCSSVPKTRRCLRSQLTARHGSPLELARPGFLPAQLSARSRCSSHIKSCQQRLLSD